MGLAGGNRGCARMIAPAHAGTASRAPTPAIVQIMYDATPPTALWDFALAAYGRPGVANLCIELQDLHGANVMLMMHLCHCAAMGTESPGIPEDAAAMAPLEHHLVAPLRRARRALAAAAVALPSAALKPVAERLLQAELAAERLQCLRVEVPAPRQGAAPRTRLLAEQQLVSYFALLQPDGCWHALAAASLAARVFPH